VTETFCIGTEFGIENESTATELSDDQGIWRRASFLRTGNAPTPQGGSDLQNRTKIRSLECR
jgi:hypothetical protein